MFQNVPRQQCTTTHERECDTVYAEVCKPVTRQVCEKVHYQEVCRDITTQECSQQPQEQCRKVATKHYQDVNESKRETVQEEVPRTDWKQASECQCRSLPRQE